MTPKDQLRAVFALGNDDIEFSLGPIFFLLNVQTITSRFEHSHRFAKGVAGRLQTVGEQHQAARIRFRQR